MAKPVLTYELALKALAWDFKGGRFISPSMTEFVWNKDGLVDAVCGANPDDPAHEVPMEGCSCGMYVSFRQSVISSYRYKSPISPILLVERWGKTILSTDGFKAKQLLVRAVLRESKYGKARFAALQAADFFKVPIMDTNQAIMAMDLQNLKLHRDWYKPESWDLQHMCKEKLDEYLAKLGVTV